MRAGPPPGERGQGRFAASRLVGPSNGRTVIGPPRGTGSPRENGDRTAARRREARARAGPGTNAGSQGTLGWPGPGSSLAVAGAFTTVPARRPLGFLL